MVIDDLSITPSITRLLLRNVLCVRMFAYIG